MNDCCAVYVVPYLSNVITRDISCFYASEHTSKIKHVEFSIMFWSKPLHPNSLRPDALSMNIGRAKSGGNWGTCLKSFGKGDAKLQNKIGIIKWG